MRFARFLGAAALLGLGLVVTPGAGSAPAWALDVTDVVPGETVGICSSLFPNSLTVLVGTTQQVQFLVNPQQVVGVSVGRRIKVRWHRRSDGLLEATSVKVLNS